MSAIEEQSPHSPQSPRSPQSPGQSPQQSDALCHTHPLTDRRRSTRLRQKFVTQMTPWAPGHASVPFEVVISDMSDVGVGIIHDEPMKIGLRHLLTVPREGGGTPVTLEYIVARCDRRSDGGYSIGLEKSVARDSVDVPVKRVVSERVKLLFLLFGLFGLLIATFAPL
jgi:hypothetical protein